MSKRTFAEDVVAALDMARALIHDGHCHRQSWGLLPDGRIAYDALGALARASRTTRIFDAGHEALKASLPTGAPARWKSVAQYNDAASTLEVSRLYGNAISAVRQAAGWVAA